MSRQNKQAKKKQIAVWVKGIHDKGNKVPRTNKLSRPNKGKCIVMKGKRVSANTSNRKED